MQSPCEDDLELLGDEPKLASKHHNKPAISLHGVLVCPHCGKVIKPGDLYTDKKQWTFHRPCLHRGSISLPAEFSKKAVFNHAYLLPPDPEEFHLPANSYLAKPALLCKLALTVSPRSGGLSRAAPGRAYWSAQNPFPGSVGDTSSLPLPEILLPLAGTAGGALLARKRLRGALHGLLAGSGAALGQHLAGNATEGDMGARLGGGLAGGVLGYLLGRAIPGD